MLSNSCRPQRKSLVNCSTSELKQALIDSATNLSKLNNRINNFRRWINQALSLAGFIFMLHPGRISFLPLVNSLFSMFFDRVVSLCIDYKVSEFRQVVQVCILKQNISEAILQEMGQIVLMLNLPESAKEALKEALIIIGAETAVLNLHKQHHRKKEEALSCIAA
jgi:hypothetical protein